VAADRLQAASRRQPGKILARVSANWIGGLALLGWKILDSTGKRVELIR
jgi:hypothetical protein